MSREALIGKQLGNFQLERLLGEGGMGQVYYGRDVRLNRPVAVKIIDARFRHNPSYAKRFEQEAQTVATWRHENIAQVYYADEQDGLYYFAMEYIDGMDLGKALLEYSVKNELLPQDEVLRIGRAIASALDYAHARDVVHRDVKPQNVMVARDGRVVLTDFGLALDTQQGSVGEVFGTAHYIAPEQARRSSDAVPQSDIYSLGIILYEMLAGRVPFDDPSPTAVALQHVMEPPPAPRSLNPSLNEATETVLLKVLAKQPQERYQSGKLLMDALENALENDAAPVWHLPPPPAWMQTGQSASAPVPTVTEPRQITQSRPRSKSAPWMALAGCFGLVVIGLVIAALAIAIPLFTPKASPQTPSPVASISTSQPSSAPVKSGADATPTSALGASPTQTIVPPTPNASPTVLYPDGKRVKLFYNDASLYFLNLSQSDIPINWVAFERLNNAGMATNRFDGSRWGKFYGTSTPNRCMAIQILDAKAYLNPPECGGSNQYLSLRTPTDDDPTVFWTTQPGSLLFRVLWREGGKDQEVARCEIGAGACEVFFP